MTAITRRSPQLDSDTMNKLVTSGNLSGLSKDEQTAYYIYRCQLLDLDPSTQPFDFLMLQGKLTLYAKKECSSQLASKRNLSVTIPSQGPQGDIYVVQARVKGGDGRETDDLGAVSIKGKSGDDLCNAMMKAATKAKRRAILTHCGLGMLDESELETIRSKWGDSGSKEAQAEVRDRKLAEMGADRYPDLDGSPQDAPAADIREDPIPEATQFTHKPIPGVINEAMASYPTGEPLTKPSPPSASPQGSVRVSFKVLDKFKVAKKAIGEAKYYEILRSHGFQKSNEVPDLAKAKAILTEMQREQELQAAYRMEQRQREQAEADAASLVCHRSTSGCDVRIANAIRNEICRLKGVAALTPAMIEEANMAMETSRADKWSWEDILAQFQHVNMEGKK
jgi:hypothetical protein